ncbi:MAG: metalloregulator ArsR/SmtB family transcription factor [Methanobrevibacter sp.]|jgi:ArsR family transcriptional regulator|nr:metalloregulator ArsR/SmtB family transcription factor [Candidatus Methanoflexus mossambicus]
MSKVCEIKSIRSEILLDVEDQMLKDDKYQINSNLFKLLSDYNRFRILDALYLEELCVCELSLLLDMSQSAISHQLRLLKANGIVNFRKEEKKVYYSLKNSEIREILEKVHLDG